MLLCGAQVKVARDVAPGERLLVEAVAARPRDGVLLFRERTTGGGAGDRRGGAL